MLDLSHDDDQRLAFEAFMQEVGGFSIVEPDRGSGRTTSTAGGGDAGMYAHRGVLSPGEYVDPFIMRDELEVRLGFTYKEIEEAYTKGRPKAAIEYRREMLDEALLEIQDECGNIAALCTYLPIDERTARRAIARAREKQPVRQPQAKRAPVKTDRACFKCGDTGVHVRAHVRDTKAGREGRESTIALCDPCYTNKFRQRGSDAYWYFRRNLRNPPGHVSTYWAFQKENEQ